MDLLLILGALYAWECLKTLPSNAVVFAKVLGRFRVWSGAGVRFFSPRPSAVCHTVAWFPFRVDGHEIETAVPVARTGLPDRGQELRTAALSPDSSIEVVGPLLKIDGRAFLRSISHAHARRVRRICRRLAVASPDRRARTWRAVLRRSWNAREFRRQLRRARRATRWLALLCDAYVALVFVITPATILWMGEEAALLFAAPLVAVLHATGIAALVQAQRSLNLQDGSERWERTLVAALYPPSLWRAPQELLSDALVGFSPAAAAAAHLDAERFAAFARRRLAILDASRAVCDPEEGATDRRLERRALKRMASGRGLELADLRRPPRRQDGAAAYCPICLATYRPAATVCRDCDVELLAFDIEHYLSEERACIARRAASTLGCNSGSASAHSSTSLL